MPNAAAIYTRISQEDQSTYSLATQEATCRELAEREGYTVVDVFCDDGYTSETLNRPALERLRDLIRSEAITAAIAHSIDRLSRKVGHQLLLEEEACRHHVRLLFVTTPNDDSPEGRLTAHIKGAVSEYELEVTRERTRRGKRARAQAGLPQLGYGVPYGYTYQPIGPDSKGELVINPAEASIVVEIYQLRISGMGGWRIAKLLTLRGVPSKHGKSYWSPQSVVNILRNPAYVGQMFYGKKQYVEPTTRRNPHTKRVKTASTRRPPEEWISLQVPAILDQATFDAAQAAMTNHKATNPRRRKHFYLLIRGHLMCQCGRAMGGFYDANLDRRRYRCWRRDTPHCGRSVDAGWIEQKAWDAVEHLLELDPFYVETELKRRAQAQPPRYRPEDQEVIAQRCREIETKRQRWRDAYAGGVIELEEFSKLRGELDHEEAQLQTLQREIASELDRVHQRDIEVSNVLDLLMRVKHDIQSYGQEERARVIHAFGLKIIYTDRENWRCVFNLPTGWEPDVLLTTSSR